MSIWELSSITINRMNITGNEMFDMFFTVGSFFGVLSFAISTLVKLISRS